MIFLDMTIIFSLLFLNDLLTKILLNVPSIIPNNNPITKRLIDLREISLKIKEKILKLGDGILQE